MRLTRSVVELALGKLARRRKPDRIAARLRKLGVKGFRYGTAVCPLANYLRLEFGRRREIRVGRHTATVSGIHVNLPKPLHEFVANFDGGEYGFLREQHQIIAAGGDGVGPAGEQDIIQPMRPCQ